MKELSNVSSKELAMIEADATRERSWLAVADALSATKMTVDKFGEEHTEDDHTIRLRAAELIARATGDIKPDTFIDNSKVQVNIGAISPIAFKELLDTVVDVRAQLSGLKSSGRQTGEIIDV